MIFHLQYRFPELALGKHCMCMQDKCEKMEIFWQAPFPLFFILIILIIYILSKCNWKCLSEVTSPFPRGAWYLWVHKKHLSAHGYQCVYTCICLCIYTQMIHTYVYTYVHVYACIVSYSKKISVSNAVVFSYAGWSKRGVNMCLLPYFPSVWLPFGFLPPISG